MSLLRNEQPEHVVSYWIRNLVGSSGAFSTNLLISVLGGSLYSFGIIKSNLMLLIFGVVSPLIFTLCLYFFIRHLKTNLPDQSFPKVFTSRNWNITLMFFDMSIIVGMAILIHLDIINYFFFRFLQTFLFPMMMLFILRFLYISQVIGRNDSED